MREILFRGKRKDNGEWVEGDLRHGGYYLNDPDVYICVRFADTMINYPVDPETVGQYTGMRDCKRTEEYPEGQMIFEWDIVKCRHEFHNWDWKLYGRDKEEAFRTKKIRRAYKKEVFKDDYSCSCYYLRNYVIAVRDGAWEIRNGSDGHGKKRLLEDLDYLENILEAYESGLLTVDDMISTVKEETGVELVVEHWKGERDGK